jgi:hypothetical protein
MSLQPTLPASEIRPHLDGNGPAQLPGRTSQPVTPGEPQEGA